MLELFGAAGETNGEVDTVSFCDMGDTGELTPPIGEKTSPREGWPAFDEEAERGTAAKVCGLGLCCCKRSINGPSSSSSDGDWGDIGMESESID